MKAYGIFPAFDLADQNDVRVQSCLSLVTEMVCARLRHGGDSFHYVVDWRDPETSVEAPICHEDLAEPHVSQLADRERLEDYVRRAVDPFGSGGGTVRSIATCRAATFGYDGQAFLCLRHEDEAPVSPDRTLVVVEERPDLLTETDYFDGWVRAAGSVGVR